MFRNCNDDNKTEDETAGFDKLRWVNSWLCSLSKLVQIQYTNNSQTSRQLAFERFISWTAFFGILVNLAHNKFFPDTISVSSFSITFFLFAIGVSLLQSIVGFKANNKIMEALSEDKPYSTTPDAFYVISYSLSAISYLIGLCLLIHSFIGLC